MKPILCPWADPVLLTAAAGDVEGLRRELSERKHIVNLCDSEFQRTPLHWAVLGGHDAVVLLLLAHHADANTRDSFGDRTPLLDAIASEADFIVAQLINAGACADATDIRGDTPLIFAVKQGSFIISKLLLEAGADPNIRDWHRGQSALSLAAERGQGKTVELLLGHNAAVGLADDQGIVPLEYALRNDNEDIARQMAERSAREESTDVDHVLSTAITRLRVNEAEPSAAGRGNDSTTLLEASRNGCLDQVREVLERNVDMDIDIKDENGRTPLWFVAGTTDLKVAKTLLDRGADVNTADDGELTPLMIAAEQGCEEIGTLLLERGANLHAHCKDGWTSLHTAATHGHVGLVRKLLDAGADPDVLIEGEHLTPLGSAARHDQLAVVELLLARGASPNKDGQTLRNAVTRDRTLFPEGDKLVQLLVLHGADVFDESFSDEKPLVWAAEYGLEDIVELFLQAPYSTSKIRQEHIEEAICIAAENEDEGVVDMLMEHYIRGEGAGECDPLWRWAKDQESEEISELLRPYFYPNSQSDDDSGSDLASGPEGDGHVSNI